MNGRKAKKLRKVVKRLIVGELPVVTYVEHAGRRLDGKFFKTIRLGHCQRKLYKGLKRLNAGN